MRILVVSNFLPPRILGGFELACYNMSKGLMARGHNVLVLTSPTDMALPEPQPFVDRCLSLRWVGGEGTPTNTAVLAAYRHESQVSSESNTQIILDRIRTFQPDVVMYFNLVGLGGLAILKAVDSTGTPWVMNLGDRVPIDLVANIPENVRALFDAGTGGDLFRRGAVCAVSETLVNEIRALGVELDNVEIVPRGVVMRDVVRTRDYRQDGVTRFIFAGALQGHKGIDIILRAVRLLLDEGAQDFSVDLYGSGLRDYFEQMARDLDVAAHVNFRGSVSQREVIEANAASDAFLFPTWSREPGASTPVEAAVGGTITILTGNCGPAERIVDGFHGIKIRRTDRALADAMRRVVDGEVDLAAMGANARRLAATDLSFDTSVERVERVLDRVRKLRLPGNVGGRTPDAEAEQRHSRAQELLNAGLDEGELLYA
jgi:glycogen(starch) synthase